MHCTQNVPEAWLYRHLHPKHCQAAVPRGVKIADCSPPGAVCSTQASWVTAHIPYDDSELQNLGLGSLCSTTMLSSVPLNSADQQIQAQWRAKWPPISATHMQIRAIRLVRALYLPHTLLHVVRAALTPHKQRSGDHLGGLGG